VLSSCLLSSVARIITLGVHICLQHVRRDAARRAGFSADPCLSRVVFCPSGGENVEHDVFSRGVKVSTFED